MNTLAISTAFSKANIALKHGDKNHLLEMNSSSKHSENLILNIEKLLSSNNLKIKDIDNISVVVGPGSFTGLRISIATIKGIAVSFPNINLIPINSLELLAYSFFKNNKEKKVTIILDALSGYFYIGEYDNKLNPLIMPKLIKFDELKEYKNNVIISNEKSEIFDSIIISYNSQDLIDFTQILIEKKRFVKERDILPLYLRTSQAEDNLKIKENK